MAKKESAKSIVQKGLRQETMPSRLKFTHIGRSTDSEFIYKGFLSTCPLVYACFGEHDKPLEFYLVVSTKTGKAKVSLGI